MWDVIQSAGWIIYYLWSDQEPRYLIIKRYALSKKIERVAPKGKIQVWEKSDLAALREVSEETGIPINQIKIIAEMWKTELRSKDSWKWLMDKDVTYFLMEFRWDPSAVEIQKNEWYIGTYKWATIDEVLWLVYYKDIRELFRDTYHVIKNQKKKNDIKKNFISTLEL